MGYLFTDKYSLLHFATGIVVYYWNMSFWTWFFIHALFELVENTQTGMYVINHLPRFSGNMPLRSGNMPLRSGNMPLRSGNMPLRSGNMPLWPGGKTHADSLINSIGDQTYASLGWIFAKIICPNI